LSIPKRSSNGTIGTSKIPPSVSMNFTRDPFLNLYFFLISAGIVITVKTYTLGLSLAQVKEFLEGLCYKVK